MFLNLLVIQFSVSEKGSSSSSTSLYEEGGTQHFSNNFGNNLGT